jgi:VanZ family protein
MIRRYENSQAFQPDKPPLQASSSHCLHAPADWTRGMRVSFARRWAQWRPALKVIFFAVLLLALYLGLRPSPTPAAYSWVSDLYHAGGLFVLMLLSYLSFPHWRWWARGLMIFALGVGIEYVQSFHPLRVADWSDLGANGVGVLSGWVVIFLFRQGSRGAEG